MTRVSKWKWRIQIPETSPDSDKVSFRSASYLGNLGVSVKEWVHLDINQYEESFSIVYVEEDHCQEKAYILSNWKRKWKHEYSVKNGDINCYMSFYYFMGLKCCVMSIFTPFRMLPWSWYRFLNKDLELSVSYLLMEWFQMLHFVNKILLGVLWLMRSDIAYSFLKCHQYQYLSLFFFDFITSMPIRYWIFLVLEWLGILLHIFLLGIIVLIAFFQICWILWNVDVKS